ncbi:piggyBac transposable element-derived protein 3-like [Anabrus simplex]|uniref:piggyBac transposable element-derived protein 3-like n=1 Tax=Anabrus simplex TaxID=316456 RepID=UPI0035A299D4
MADCYSTDQDDVDKILQLLESGNLSDLDLSDEDDNVEPHVQSNKFFIREGGDRVLPEDTVQENGAASNWDRDFASDNVDSASNANLETTEKQNIKWRRRSFDRLHNPWHKSESETDIVHMNPINYFKLYLPDSIFEQMANFTNIYALQNNILNFNPTDMLEIQTLIGLHIATGTLKLPRVRLFWDQFVGMNLFLDSMSRDRFFKLRTNLHIVNNLDRPESCQDKMFKVRPLYNSVRERCLQLSLEENLCVDEQIVPFRGNLSFKQYVKGKPTPWGVKIFVLCGKSGQAYDFLVYQGSTTELDQDTLKKFGLGASVVLHLAKRIDGEGHKLFYDNFFSSYNLLQLLKSRKICAGGTARLNRFANPPLLCDKDLKKKGQGSFDQVVSADGDVVVVKWMDNRSVALASNFVGSGELDVVERWDRVLKTYVKVSRPEIVRLYNHAMGGVDLLDQLIALYRIYIRSRKWTLRLIFHIIDFAIVCSWLEYKRDCTAVGVPVKNVLDLLHFRMRIAESLVKAGKPQSKKRGRPSCAESQPKSNPKRSKEEQRPIPEVRQDLVDHMPHLDGNKEGKRCKNKLCNQKTHSYCDKCMVHLCIKKDRNCFVDFHRPGRITVTQ